MIEQKAFKKNLFIVTLAFVFSIIFMFIVIEKFFLENEFKKQILESSYQEISKKETYIYNLIENTSKTLVYINDLVVFKSGLKNNDYNEINNVFYTVSQSNIYFMQLRYLDKNGIEKIRIDRQRNNINPVVVKSKDLQDKSKRGYFERGKTSKNIFVTKLNLNKENNITEFPYKPTIRVVLPVLNDNEFNGIIIANIEVNLLIDSPLFDTMIIDEQRNVILPFDKNEKNFETKFQDTFSNNIDKILTENAFIENDFISYKLKIQVENKIVFIAKLKQEYFEKFQKDQLKTRITIFFILALVSILMIFYFIKKVEEIFYDYRKSKLDDKLKYSNQEFESSNKFITEEIDPELIISQAKTSMILTDAKIDIIYVNDAFVNLFLYEKSEMIGRNPRFLNQEDREQSGLEKIREAIQSTKPVTTVVRNYTKDNNLKYVELSISPIFDKKTNILKYYLGVHKDVTKEQKIMRDLRNIF